MKKVDEVAMSFVLVFDVGDDNIQAARKETKPIREMTLNNKVILFLETERKIMRNPGIFIPKKFADFVRLMAIVPKPEDGHLDGKNIVGFGAFVDCFEGKKLPSELDDLIGEYYLFELDLDPNQDEAFCALFVSIIGQKYSRSVGVSVDQDVYEVQVIVEVVDIEEEDQPNNYSLRCPQVSDVSLAATKQFKEKIRRLLRQR